MNVMKIWQFKKAEKSRDPSYKVKSGLIENARPARRVVDTPFKDRVVVHG